MNRFCLALFLLIIPFRGLLAQSTEGVVKNNVYTNGRLGWSFKIPEHFSVISKDNRVEDSQAAIRKLKASADGKGTILLLSFKKDGAVSEPKFLSGLQDKNTIGVPLVKEADFINYITNAVKRSNQTVLVKIFDKKIGTTEYSGYQLTFANKLIQRGLIKIIGHWVFYQTWVFDSEDDAKVIEDAVYSATFK